MNAKLTENHDWIRVAVTDGARRKVSLTVGRRGETCSGSVDEATMRRALTAFGRLVKSGQGTLGEKMKRLHAHAETCGDIETYVAGIDAV